MQCPVCSGVPPLLEQSIERPHAIETRFWFDAADIYAGPVPEGVAIHDFGGVLGTELAVTFQEKKKGGAALTAHYCITEGDTIFTLKSRVPLSASDRAALFGFMKDSLRHTETRGRKRSVTLDDIRRAWKRFPKNTSLKRFAFDLGVDEATVKRVFHDNGMTFTEFRRRN